MVKTYTLEQIKKAYREVFNGSGDWWFESEENTEGRWEEFTWALEDV